MDHFPPTAEGWGEVVRIDVSEVSKGKSIKT